MAQAELKSCSQLLLGLLKSCLELLLLRPQGRAAVQLLLLLSEGRAAAAGASGVAR